MSDPRGRAGGEGAAPELSVLIPSHRRPLRLRWLLNALEEQTLDRDRFEVVVAHDSWDEEIDGLLRGHPLTEAGVLRLLPSDAKSPAVKRNAGWRAARAPTVVFTDDDCRPPAGWLEGALRATRANPGAVVQGPTIPDPDERLVDRTSPYPFTQRIDVAPTLMGETCNIAYPRELLERLGGFDETVEVPAAEDTDLLWRALKSGAPHVGAPEMLTYHAVIDQNLIGRLRTLPRWEILAWLVRVHPELRKEFPMRLFWKRTHPGLLLAAAGLLVAAIRREPWWALLTLAWLHSNPPYRGRDFGLLRMVGSLPGRALVDAAEIAVLAGGSIRHRSLLL